VPTEAVFLNRPNPKAEPVPPVVVPRWVNDRCPPLAEILSARDVARLTRRPSWWLLALSVIGHFPCKARFRGRALGWRRADVLAWLARNLELEPQRVVHRRNRRRQIRPLQHCLRWGRTSHDNRH
jgi:predicted DNA-binding transcriptional regulator AlpA